MVMKVNISFSRKELKAIEAKSLMKGIGKATRRASAKSVSAMRTDASKRVRKRKRIRAKAVKKAIVPQKNTGKEIAAMSWGIHVRGDIVRLSDYPFRQLSKRGKHAGVSVTVNKGQISKLRNAFIAKFKSGHVGVFVRRRKDKRLPIREPFGSRPVDALLHTGEAEGVSKKGRIVFFKELDRVLALELDKK